MSKSILASLRRPFTSSRNEDFTAHTLAPASGKTSYARKPCDANSGPSPRPVAWVLPKSFSFAELPVDGICAPSPSVPLERRPPINVLQLLSSDTLSSTARRALLRVASSLSQSFAEQSASIEQNLLKSGSAPHTLALYAFVSRLRGRASNQRRRGREPVFPESLQEREGREEIYAEGGEKRRREWRGEAKQGGRQLMTAGNKYTRMCIRREVRTVPPRRPCRPRSHLTSRF